MNLNQYSQSAAQPGLSAEYLSRLDIPVPELAEQRRIGSFLDAEIARIAILIDKQKRLIELLKEKRQATISQAVTKGLDPGVPTKDSGMAWLGEVPAHWKVSALKHIARVQTGLAKGKELQPEVATSLPYLRVANVQDGFIDTSDVSEIDIATESVPRYLLREGDVLMNEGGDFDKLGRGAVWDARIDPCVHQNHVFAIRPVDVEPEWVAFVARSDYLKFYFMGVSKQSTNLASISSTNLMACPMTVPPVEERLRILRHVEATSMNVDRAMDGCKRSIALLNERRAALITAAVTGQIDIASCEHDKDALVA